MRRTEGAAGAGGISGAAFSVAGARAAGDVDDVGAAIGGLRRPDLLGPLRFAAPAAACGPTVGSFTPALSGLVD